MHLQTEARFWENYLEPIIKASNLQWSADVDYTRDTINLKVKNPLPASVMKQKKLTLDDITSTINIDRQKDTEEHIKKLINKAVKRLVALAV